MSIDASPLLFHLLTTLNSIYPSELDIKSQNNEVSSESADKDKTSFWSIIDPRRHRSDKSQESVVSGEQTCYS